MKEESLKNIKKLYGIDKKNILTVSQVSEYIKNKLIDDPKLNQIYVLGEITNISKPHSGHIYFDIKDENTLLSCVFFRRNNKDLSFELENGLEAVIFGSIITYEKRSVYQLEVSLILPIGEGAFYLKFKQLKEKLSKEGLFDEEHKKEIALLPRSIGLITSKTGSAIKDVFKVLKSRFPNINIKLISTSMQGDKASKEIIRAIDILNRFEYIDGIIITRGGGAIEDLMCFNDEKLARTIFKSKIPIITGIGHETDSTIADFVADKIAPTPSIAAKITVPDKQELLDRINSARNELKKSYDNFIKSKQKEKEMKKKELLDRINSLRDELKKSYGNLIKSKQKEKEIKKYKIIIAVIITVIIILIVIYSIMKYWG